ncbi:SDR family NAD(P)-dependent oxidoreductase [Variovorax sp. UC122_21]|uniref:SDR family NAD(P)-dependent oxidoreductase n=1 Tax=Variovorax TaxID=34072 RepID=UPI001933170F|nr:SDR family oxidoreductase [Variovorax paradoxus]
MTRRLEGKVALVLGAGCVVDDWGNGNAAAVAFAREGARVVCVDMNEAAAARTAGLIHAEGGEAIHAAADVADAAQVNAVVDEAMRRYGRIDVLHNNAGINTRGGVVETAEEDFDRVFDVNVKGAYLSCKAVIPIMKAQGGGSIIHVSSIASITWTGHPIVSYQASKAALNHLTRMIAVQHGPDNIRCNSILPGLIDSPRVHVTMLSFYDGDVERMREARSRCVPMKRMGDVWDVANAAVFLACDESKYITGAALPIDGGVTCTMAH